MGAITGKKSRITEQLQDVLNNMTKEDFDREWGNLADTYSDDLVLADYSYEKNIGKKARKLNFNLGQPKPFKSKSKVNTIKGVINHPILNIPAYTFVEDESYVECRRIAIVSDDLTDLHPFDILKQYMEVCLISVDRIVSVTENPNYELDVAKYITKGGEEREYEIRYNDLKKWFRGKWNRFTVSYYTEYKPTEK